MAKTISKGKGVSSRARALRVASLRDAQGGAATLAPDRDVEDLDAAELDERDERDERDDVQDVAEAPDDAQDELAYEDAADAEAIGAADDVDYDEDSEDARALALPDRSEQANRAPTQQYQRGGVYVPEFLMGNFVTRYLAEAYIELRKVTWPTRQAAWNMTLVVVVVAALTALVLGAADFGLTRLVTWLSGLSAG